MVRKDACLVSDGSLAGRRFSRRLFSLMFFAVILMVSLFLFAQTVMGIQASLCEVQGADNRNEGSILVTPDDTGTSYYGEAKNAGGTIIGHIDCQSSGYKSISFPVPPLNPLQKLTITTYAQNGIGSVSTELATFNDAKVCHFFQEGNPPPTDQKIIGVTDTCVPPLAWPQNKIIGISYALRFQGSATNRHLISPLKYEIIFKEGNSFENAGADKAHFEITYTEGGPVTSGNACRKRPTTSSACTPDSTGWYDGWAPNVDKCCWSIKMALAGGGSQYFDCRTDAGFYKFTPGQLNAEDSPIKDSGTGSLISSPYRCIIDSTTAKKYKPAFFNDGSNSGSIPNIPYVDNLDEQNAICTTPSAFGNYKPVTISATLDPALSYAYWVDSTATLNEQEICGGTEACKAVVCGQPPPPDDPEDNDCDTTPDDGCGTGSSSYSCKSNENIVASWGGDPDAVPDDVYKSSNPVDKCCGDDTKPPAPPGLNVDGTKSQDVPTVQNNYLCAANIFDSKKKTPARFQWFQDQSDYYGCVWQTKPEQVAVGGAPYLINSPEAKPRFIECSSSTMGRVVAYGNQHQFLCMRGKQGKYANQYYWAECAGDDYYTSGSAISDIPDSCPQADFNTVRKTVDKKNNNDFIFGTGESVPEFGLGCSKEGQWIDLSQADESFCTAQPNQGVWVGGRCCGGGAFEIGLTKNATNTPYNGAYFSALSSSQGKAACFQNIGIPSASTLADKAGWIVNEDWYLENKDKDVKKTYNPYHLTQFGARILNVDGNFMSCNLNSVKGVSTLKYYPPHNYQDLPLIFPQASSLPGICGVDYLPCPDINGDGRVLLSDMSVWMPNLASFKYHSSEQICSSSNAVVQALCNACKIFLEDGTPDIVACLDFNCDGQFVGDYSVSNLNPPKVVPDSDFDAVFIDGLAKYGVQTTECNFGDLYAVDSSGNILGGDANIVTPPPPEPLVKGNDGYLLHPVENCQIQSALTGDAEGAGVDYLCSYKEEGFLKDPYYTLTSSKGAKEGYIANGQTLFSAIKKAGGSPEGDFKQAAEELGYTALVTDRTYEVLEFEDGEFYYHDKTEDDSLYEWDTLLWSDIDTGYYYDTGTNYCEEFTWPSECLGVYQPVIYFDIIKHDNDVKLSIPLEDIRNLEGYTISEEHYYSKELCNVPFGYLLENTKYLLPTHDPGVWSSFPFAYSPQRYELSPGDFQGGIFESTDKVSTYIAPIRVLCKPGTTNDAVGKILHQGKVPKQDSDGDSVPAACCPGSDYCWRDPTIGSIAKPGKSANPASMYSEDHNGVAVWWVNPGCVENMVDEPLTPPQLNISYEESYQPEDTQLFEADGDLVFDPIKAGERCIDSTWQFSTKKSTWDNKYSGYCPKEDMCLVNPYADFATKTVQRPKKNVECALKCPDVNQDGSHDTNDASFLNSFIAEGGYEEYLDFNCDGTVNGADTIVLNQFLGNAVAYYEPVMDGRKSPLCMLGETIPGFYVNTYTTTETAFVPFKFDDTTQTPLNVIRQYPKIWQQSSDEFRFYSDAKFREDPDSYNIQCVPKNSYIGDHYCIERTDITDPLESRTEWITRTQIAALKLVEKAEYDAYYNLDGVYSYSLYCDRYDKVLDDYGYYVFNTDPSLINKNPQSQTASNTLKQYLEGTGFCSQQEGSMNDNACSNNLCVLVEYDMYNNPSSVAIAGALNRDIMESVKGPLSTRSFYDTIRYADVFVKRDGTSLPEDLSWCDTEKTEPLFKGGLNLNYLSCKMQTKYPDGRNPVLEWYGKYTDSKGGQHDNYDIFILYSDYHTPDAWSAGFFRPIIDKFLLYLKGPLSAILTIINTIKEGDIAEYNIFQGIASPSGTRTDLMDWFQRVRITKDYPAQSHNFNKFFLIKMNVGAGIFPGSGYKEVFGVMEQGYFKPELSQLDSQKSYRGYMAIGYRNFEIEDKTYLENKINKYKEQISFSEPSEETGAGDMVIDVRYTNYSANKYDKILLGYLNWEFTTKTISGKDFTQPGDNIDFTFIPPLARVFEDFAPETRIKYNTFDPNSVCKYSAHTVYGEGCPADEYPVLVMNDEANALAVPPGYETLFGSDENFYVCVKQPTKADTSCLEPSIWINVDTGLGYMTKTACGTGNNCVPSCFDIGTTTPKQLDPASFKCEWKMRTVPYLGDTEFCVVGLKDSTGKFSSCDYLIDHDPYGRSGSYSHVYACTCSFTYIIIIPITDPEGNTTYNITIPPGEDPDITIIVQDPRDPEDPNDDIIIIIITDPRTGETITIPDVKPGDTIIINGEEYTVSELGLAVYEV